jgi:uncharacterized protein (TIGR03085 family)
MSLARTERAALADLFEQVGPDQPTLCEGWQTKDLLIHLLVRERDPLGAVGAAIKPLHGFTEKAQDGYRTRPWADLIRDYREGPPAWNPTGWGPLNDLTNGGEMFIHHEDVRRGQPGWRPRELSPQDTAELTRSVKSGLSRLMLRKADSGIVARLPGVEPVVLRKGEPVVTLTGEPGEIVLWVSGRDAVEIEFDGDPAAVGNLRTLQRGF